MLHMAITMEEAGHHASRTITYLTDHKYLYHFKCFGLMFHIRNLQDTILMLLSVFPSDYNSLNIMP